MKFWFDTHNRAGEENIRKDVGKREAGGRERPSSEFRGPPDAFFD
jgi:hypothetical protein